MTQAISLSISPDFVLQFILMLCSIGAAYAAIRADLRESLITANMARESALGAHKRIDNLQGDRRNV